MLFGGNWIETLVVLLVILGCIEVVASIVRHLNKRTSQVATASRRLPVAIRAPSPDAAVVKPTAAFGGSPATLTDTPPTSTGFGQPADSITPR